MKANPYPETARFGAWLTDAHVAAQQSANGPSPIKWARSDSPTRRTPEADRQEVLCAELNRAIGTSDDIAS